MVDYWIILGILAAFGGAAFQIYQKYLAADISSIKIAHQSNLIAVPIAALVVPFFSGTSRIPLFALFAVIISGTISGSSYWLLAKAYQTEDLSTISPLRGLSPVMVAVVEPLVFPEGYSFWVLVAAFLSGVGVYSVLIEGDLMSPIRGITRTGVQLGLFSTSLLIFTILINRTSLHVFDASADIYSVYFLFFTALSTAVISFAIGGKDELTDTITPTLVTAPLGVFRSVLIVSSLGALYFATGTKVTILLQFGLLIAVLFGGTIMDEQYFSRRILGAIAIVSSAVIIILFG